MLSFLRARPDCGSLYHESKWAAEELVRASGLDYTIFKAGVIYGRGDHMLDHISHALHTFPAFLLVGFTPKAMRPLAVEDLVSVMVASIVNGRLSDATVPITGPEQMDLRELASRIARVSRKRPVVLPAPVWVHYAMAWVFERTMAVPLAAKAQVRILSESLAEPMLAQDKLPGRFAAKDSPSPTSKIRAGLRPNPVKVRPERLYPSRSIGISPVTSFNTARIGSAHLSTVICYDCVSQHGRMLANYWAYQPSCPIDYQS